MGNNLMLNNELMGHYEFSPFRMSRNLKRDANGTVYFNRVAALKNCTSSMPEKRFNLILANEYHESWGQINTKTLYLDEKDGSIFIGVYDIMKGKKSSCCDITKLYHPYTYTQEEIDTIIQAIKNA